MPVNEKSWLEIIEHPEEELYFGGKNTELYFEEDNFDQFIEMLEDLPEIQYVHPVKEIHGDNGLSALCIVI